MEKKEQINWINTRTNSKNLTLCAMLLAIGIVLPNFTGPQLGSILLPMHIPALLAGIIVGWKYGLMVGILIPIFRSFLFGMPPLLPIGLAMAIELGTYAFISGIIYNKKQVFSLKRVYMALIGAMLIGRVTFGLAMFTMLSGLGLGMGVYSFSIWFTSVFVSSWVGILIHLFLIPLVVSALNRSGFFHRN